MSINNPVLTNVAPLVPLNPKETTEQRPHISVSQINEYLNCGAYYMFHKVYKIRVPSRSYFTIGGSVHKGAEINYKQKKSTRTNLSLKEVLDVTANEFEGHRIKTIWKKDEDPDVIKDQVLELAKVYYNEVGSKIQPVIVEEQFTVEHEDLIMPVVFRIDLVDEDGYIRDIKTPGKTPSQNDIDKDLQLTTYSFGYRRATGKIEKGVILDNVVKTKIPKYAPLQSTRTEQDLRRFVNIANAAIMAIQAGSYVPDQKSFKCSEENCDFWEKCHEVF